ncbi:MAG: ABC transporter ATP-binding protein [Deltaproteobacteria bacterium]|nr:ABC transporter ATP-binding protein [Deltaproteobacteria bacterium]
MSVISVSDLSVRYRVGEQVNIALDQVDLKLEDGERCAVVGRSGAGKSTLILALLGLLEPNAVRAASELRVVDCDLLSGERIAPGRVGVVFQEPAQSLNPVVRVGKQLDQVLRAGGVPNSAERQRRAQQQLSSLGIADVATVLEAYPHQLSGGLAQRVAIAMALVNRPCLLIADEPTAALDPLIRASLLSLLVKESAKRALACLMITHELSIARDFCQSIAVIEGGRIVERGALPAVLEAPRHAHTAALVAADRLHSVWGAATGSDGAR